MNEIISYSNSFLNYAKHFFGWIFGGIDSLIYALILFVVFDYITGLFLAFKEKKISSNIGFSGITKKNLIFIVVALASILDKYILNTGGSLREIIVLFYIANEGISVIENAGKLGLPIPQKLKDAIQKLNSNNK
jgi:toxin secretion/phage lysis holin